MNLENKGQPSPQISVVMGVYNQWDREALRRAVRSVLDQTFRDFEFIIYDDGSHPEAAEMIRELEGWDSRISVIGMEENKGLAFSLNACIAKANGKYIARMDADDISMPERLAVQYRFMEQNPQAAWCGCNARLFDDGGIWGSRRMPEQPGKKDYLKYSPFIHPTVMYRAEVLRENGGYLEAEETRRCEDYEIFMRLQQEGLSGVNLQQYLFLYREDQESFRRRTMRHRVHEMKVRFANFRRMGILFPFGWVQVMRPVAGGILPGRAVAWLKRNESKDRKPVQVPGSGLGLPVSQIAVVHRNDPA